MPTQDDKLNWDALQKLADSLGYVLEARVIRPGSQQTAHKTQSLKALRLWLESQMG